MTNNLTISPPSCTNLKGVVYKLCLPEVIKCYVQDTTGLITLCDKVYNCNRCQSDGEYYVPFMTGDKIMLQTQIKDTTNDKQNPSLDTYTVCMIGSGTKIDVNTFLSKSMVAYGCKKSFQIWEIDTSLFTDDCFKLEFSTSEETYCSQEFRREKCANTVLVSSDRSGSDCLGNCYDTPSSYDGDLIEYTNALRVHGIVLRTGTETSYNGKRVVIRDKYSLKLTKPIAEFMLNYLTKSIFGTDLKDEYSEVYINGELYYFEGLNVTNKIYSNMFLIEFEIFKECKTTFSCKK